MKRISIRNFSAIVPLFVVLLLSCALLFINLGKNSLANWDEAWYADASRFMFRNDRYFTPVWNNQYFFDKPPLQYWFTQPFLRILGETELAYRLPSEIASVVTVLVLYLWAKNRTGVAGGLVAAVVLLSFPHFVDRSRSGNFDALFTMWTTLSLYLFSVKKKPTLGGICLGLAWLTKGIFPGFFPIVVIAFFLIFDMLRSHSIRLLLPSLRFTLTAFLIYSPWHFLELTRFEQLIDNSYFATFDQGTFGSWNWMEIADRFNLRYLVFLWTFLRLWFPVALVALWWSFVRLSRTLTLGKDRMMPWSFLSSSLPFLSFFVIFLSLSAAREKNDWYLMPTYPFVALLISDFTHRVFQRRKRVLLFLLFSFSISNLYLYRKQAFPTDTHLVEKEVALFVKDLTAPDDLIVTAEYEFPTLRYYSEREVRTAARQPDFQGKYWWIWDNVDIETALRRGRKIVVITRLGAEWPVDVWGYHREKIGAVNGRDISRIVLNESII